MTTTPKIFISYSYADSDRVHELSRRLSLEGFSPWTDTQILGGEPIDNRIRKEIQSSDFFLACLSKNYLNSEWSLSETEYALVYLREKLDSDIYVIPVRLEDCEVPENLARFSSVDLFTENGWARLVEAIRVGTARREEIDSRLLEACTDVISIAQVHRKLAANELEDPVSSLLRSFSRISQDMDAALHQESAYNQRLALSAIEDRLDSLLREVFRSRESYAIRFRPITSSWREIVARRVRELAETVEQRQEIDSPYVIGVPLTEIQEIFVGRTDVSARIEQLLLDRRRPPLLLYGQRRMGKTSLLLNLGRLLPSTIVPLFVDLQGAVVASNHAGLLYGIARSMAASAEKQRGLILPALSRESLADDPFTRFHEWLDEVEKVLETNTALLALDEFETLFSALADGRFSETDVLGMLRHLIQHRPRFKVLLAGSHTLDEFRRWASYLINAQVIKLSYLKEEETLQLIERPVPDFALRYEPEAAHRVLNLTRGHPFLVQQLCAEIVALKNEQDPAIRRVARLSDVEAAIPEALGHGALFFSDIENNQVDSTGMAVLRLIATRGEGAIVNQSELTSEFGDEFETALDLLLRRDLIEPIDGGYRFQVEIIRHWFAQPSRVDRSLRSVKSWLRRAIP